MHTIELTLSDWNLTMGKDAVDPFSTYLFSSPSFMEGVGRLADLGGTFDEYNTSNSPVEADLRALYADCMAVGKDMIAGMERGLDGQEETRE